MSLPDYHKPMPPHAKRVFQGKLFSVWQWEQTLYDGSIAIFERIKRRDTVHTIGVLPDNRILLTKDEQPDRNAVLTPAGGQIEPDETPQEAARREFLEETGYQIGELVAWHTYQPSGKIDWTVHSFIGRKCERISDPQPEAGEKIEVLLLSFDQFLALGTNPDMRDPLIRIILLEAQLDKTKRANLRTLLYE